MERVFVGLSGGVDSSVSAYLLKKAGYEVSAFTFTALNEEGFKKCCSIEEINAARRVASFLEIPHKVVDIKDLFFAKIVRYFIDSYSNGLTPNPCVYCNRMVKFGAMMDYALNEGADFIATGHYANIVLKDGENLVQSAHDKTKDQSYFLSYIETERLPYIKLPLGQYLKSEVRALVTEAGLPVATDKAESQDICFIKDDYRDFLKERGVKENEGEFIYRGKVVGRHRGIPFYTYGQRRGLGIALGERVFIEGFDCEKNRIYLGEKPITDSFTVTDLQIHSKHFKNGIYQVALRYQSRLLWAEVSIEGVRAYVKLSEGYPLVTAGQFAVFYREDTVVAAGVIHQIGD